MRQWQMTVYCKTVSFCGATLYIVCESDVEWADDKRERDDRNLIYT